MKQSKNKAPGLGAIFVRMYYFYSYAAKGTTELWSLGCVLTPSRQ
jgi:hypothetical protein